VTEKLHNAPRYSLTIGNTQHINKTEVELLAIKGIGQVTIDELKSKAALEAINKHAFIHIDKSYPQWKQANITRMGTAEQKATMDTFIDAVRDWANSAEPQLEDLTAIKA